MFTVKNYLCIPGNTINDLDYAAANPDEFFIDIDKEDEILAVINKFDTDYIEGAIYLTFWNDVIMDFRLWDCVDQLWAYIITLIAELGSNGYAETYFPDQPTKMVMTKLREDSVSLRIIAQHDKIWVLQRGTFLEMLLREAESFFIKMIAFFPQNHNNYQYELNRIKDTKLALQVSLM